MSPSFTNSGGYPQLILYKDGKKTGKYVHHLVLEAFTGPCPDGYEARHLDGIASSAALRNADGKIRLIWGTSSENKFDEVEHGTHPEARRTHCDNGHEWTEKNTRIERYPDGSFKARRCRECKRIDSAARKLARETDERRCKEKGCGKPYFGRGWCSTHYNEWYKEQPGFRERAAANQRRYAAKVKSGEDQRE